MPRHPAKVTQGEIARVIRAAKKVGGVEMVVDGEGQIRRVLSGDVPATSMLSSKEDDDAPVWTMSAPAKKKPWSLEMPLLGANSKTPAQTLIRTMAGRSPPTQAFRRTARLPLGSTTRASTLRSKPTSSATKKGGLL
jgi:hypothetical protein